MINYSTLENNKKIDYKELIKMLLNLLNHLISKKMNMIIKMMKFALVIFFVVGLIHVLMIILIY